MFLRNINGKVKGHPRTGHEGPEGGQRYRPTLSLTSVLDGVGGQRHAPAALPPGKTQYLLYRRLSGPQGRSGRVRKISPPPGFDPGPSSPQRVAIPTEISRPLPPKCNLHKSPSCGHQISISHRHSLTHAGRYNITRTPQTKKTVKWSSISFTRITRSVSSFLSSLPPSVFFHSFVVYT